MKVAIIGAGAMGCLYGGLLSQNKTNEVYLIDVWQEHIDAINNNGLIIEKNRDSVKFDQVKGITNSDFIGFVDLVLIFVKSTETREAMENNKLIFGPDTIGITLQNGLGNIDIISDIIGADNVLAGTTAHGATVIGPGKIRHAGSGITAIGELTGEITCRLQEIAFLLNEAQIETTVSKNVVGLVWDKLLVNVGINALTGITRLENGNLLKYPEIEQLLVLAVEEGKKVAQAQGINLEFEDSVEHTKEVCRATAENKSSMLQDIMKGRKTEIEMLNGAIVRAGEDLGIETPINLALTNIIKFIQRN